jgi:hypothetical protein
MRREGCQCGGNIIWRCGRRETGRSSWRFQSTFLDCLCMSIGRASSSTRSLKGTWDVQCSARSTWRPRLVALDTAVISTRSFSRMDADQPLLCECCKNRTLCANGFPSGPRLHSPVRVPMRSVAHPPHVHVRVRWCVHGCMATAAAAAPMGDRTDRFVAGRQVSHGWCANGRRAGRCSHYRHSGRGRGGSDDGEVHALVKGQDEDYGNMYCFPGRCRPTCFSSCVR